MGPRWRRSPGPSAVRPPPHPADRPSPPQAGGPSGGGEEAAELLHEAPALHHHAEEEGPRDEAEVEGGRRGSRGIAGSAYQGRVTGEKIYLISPVSI